MISELLKTDLIAVVLACIGMGLTVWYEMSKHTRNTLFSSAGMCVLCLVCFIQLYKVTTQTFAFCNETFLLMLAVDLLLAEKMVRKAIIEPRLKKTPQGGENATV